MKEVIEELERRRDNARLGGGIQRIEAQHKRGKLTARERIELLMDENSFEEFDTFVEHRCTEFGMEKSKVPGDGVVTGWGTINGRVVYVFAKDFTVIGGSLSESHARKMTKIQDMALKNRAPIIGLFDAGGARIQEGVDALGGYGEVFHPQRHGLRRHPADLGHHGPLRRRRRLFARHDRLHLHGEGHELHVRHWPRRREDGDQRNRDGRRTWRRRVHTTKSSIADRAYENDVEALLQMRRLMDFLPSLNNKQGVPELPTSDSPDREDFSLDTLIPDNPNKPYDMKELILKVVDEGDFFEIQEAYAKNIITGFARMEGRTVGIVANQPMVLAGVLDSDASRKAARFVRFCDCFEIPIVTFVDVPGFLPGTAPRSTAASSSTAPSCSLRTPRPPCRRSPCITRKAYGGAYDVMSSKHIRGDMNYAWPTAEIAVMGAKGAAEIICIASELADPDKIKARIDEYQKRFAKPVRRRRARLHRRSDPAARHAPPHLPRAQYAAQQDTREPLEEARQHSALSGPAVYPTSKPARSSSRGFFAVRACTVVIAGTKINF